jgi:hypothetical protein
VGLHEIKAFCTTKAMVSKLKVPVTEESLFQLCVRQGTDRRYRKQKKLNSPKFNDPMKEMVK